MKLDDLRGLWRGRTVVCIASGPSLTAEDCELVKAVGLPTIVVNTSFRLAPWADILFAMDAGWWSAYRAEVDETFPGSLWSYVSVPGVISTKHSLFRHGFGNSGAYAIAMAVKAEAGKVLLLGYDCQHTNGMSHWHGDHPEQLSNAASARWPQHFDMVADYAAEHGVHVINCSRVSALTRFVRSDLERELRNADSRRIAESSRHDSISGIGAG